MINLGRATVVLDAIAESRGPQTLTELAVRTGLPRSTVHRLIRELEDELYVVRVPHRPGYVLGPGVLKFGMNAHLRLLAANRAMLAALAREVRENVELAIFSGREVVVIDQIASPDRLRGVTQVGKAFSLHSSAIGMALLAQLTDERVAGLLPAQLERFTAKTVTDRAALLARLRDIRRSHVAVDMEQHNIGISAVATGLWGPTGALQAIAVVMPTSRFKAKAALAIQSLRLVNDAVQPALALEQHQIT